MKKNTLISLSLFVLLVFAQIEAFACTCITDTDITYEQSIKFNLKNAKAVFTGKVLEVADIFQSNDVNVKIQVDKIWKGNLSKFVVITTSRFSSACGYKFEKGKSYLVFARTFEKSGLKTHLCLPNREIIKAGQELKILGKALKPKKKKI